MIINSSSSSSNQSDDLLPSSFSVKEPLLVSDQSVQDATQDIIHHPSIELPTTAPLSHQIFRDPNFDPDEFLLSRRHTSLDDLRTELRTYLFGLRTELVGLINDDYEDFIGLGIGLRGTVERAMGKMKAPLEVAKQNVKDARSDLQNQWGLLQNFLTERRQVLNAKKLIRLMIDCGDSVSKVEEILSIHSSLPDPSSQTTKPHQILHLTKASSSHAQRPPPELILDSVQDSSSIETKTKTIQRITTEYNRMLYLVSKANEFDYVIGLKPRIDRITENLYRQLASLLKISLHSPRSDQFKRDCLLECLRAYDTLGAVHQAEEVIKNELVLSEISQLIHHNSLSATSTSPVLPVSPEVSYLKSNSTSNYFTNSNATLQFIPLPLPEDPHLVHLPLLYNKILAFIARELALVLDLADRQLAQSKQSSTAPLETLKDESSSTQNIITTQSNQNITFNILINSVISPILQSLTTTLGGNLFAAGNPNTFHRNYSHTSRFLDQLEAFCCSPSQLLTLRANPEWRAFKSKWQLAVYAQLRTKEVILKLEEGLNDGTKLVNSNFNFNNFDKSKSTSIYLMRATDALDRTLRFIWQDDVFLADLTHRFWRLTLMAISRYSTWLNATTSTTHSKGVESTFGNSKQTSAEFPRLAGPAAGRPGSANSSRPGTPLANSSADEAGQEEQVKESTMLLVDITRLSARIMELFDKEISSRLPNVSVGSDSQKLSEILQISLSKIMGFMPMLSDQLTSILVKRCSEKLRFIRSVGSSARAAKSIPKEASYFISDILNDLRSYLDRFEQILPTELRIQLVTSVIDELSAKYLAILINVQRSEDSLRKLKKGKQGFSIFSNNRSASINHNDHNKIPEDELRVKMQLSLDVEKLEKDSIELGANLSESKSFHELKQIVAIKK
ncbi:hypothetical protein O181_015514 [Austropuccinia psidii MF-1]|uniref:Conserved oligomeric Golgi complex subunit 2 n=1 Tax=Austropuccinia psidii MF-1 TaxID=1389203 RepID=A0A9Q3C028_9BASI|nr:hypothetical protein [Austropuccinia psidii MF-1]